MSVTLAKVKALKPDVLVVSGHEKGALTAVTQLKALKVDVPFVTKNELSPLLCSSFISRGRWG